MIRQQEIVTFLSALSRDLAGQVRNELSTDTSKLVVDSSVMVLDRLIAQLGNGERIAGARLEIWRDLEASFTGNAKRSPPAAGAAPSASLQAVFQSLQERLEDPNVFRDFVAALRQGDADRSGWLAASSSALSDLMEAVEESYRPTPTTKDAREPDDPGLLREALNIYLAKRYAGLSEAPVISVSPISGGSVKLTALVTMAPNPELPERLILRKDKSSSITGSSVVDEYPIVERVSALGLPVPKPLLLESDPSPLDGAFMLMSEISGAALAGTYFAKERALQPRRMGPDFAREVAAVMARLHGMTEIKADRGSRANADQLARAKKLHETWLAAKKPPNSIGVDLGFAWLFSHDLPSPRPRCLVHGDFSAHNMLARDGHLAAVLDWELAHDGDPAEDLAHWRMLMTEDTIPWEQFVDAYVKAGGDPIACDPKVIAYYCVWDYLNHSVMNTQFRDYFISGVRTDAFAAQISSHSFERLQQFLARSLDLAITTYRRSS